MDNRVKMIFISILFCTNIFAQQTYYYNQSGSIQMGYIRYDWIVGKDKMVTLFNDANVWTNEEQEYKDGRPLDEEFYNAKRSVYVVNDTWTKPMCYSIVNDAFSDEEKERLKGEKLGVSLYISPETGTINDVEFTFLSLNPFATIHPSVYYKIEQELKKNISFTITDKGKELNYIYQWWRQEIK